jgi:sec-independent protein translocase protein TatC
MSQEDLPEETPPEEPAADQPLLRERSEMPFLDHLEELRWSLLKALATVIVCGVVCLIFVEDIYKHLTAPYHDAVHSLETQRSSDMVESLQALVRQWIGDQPAAQDSTAKPSVPAEHVAPENAAQATTDPDGNRPLPLGRRLQSIKVMSLFFVRLQIAFFGGLVLALPVVFYQIWKFVAPGLLASEKRLALPLIAMSVACFASGTWVAYRIVLPLGLRFFLGLEPADTTSQWAVNEYMSFVMRLLIGFGIVFEMPVLSLLLTRIGIITPQYLRQIRRYAVIGIFVMAAFFTPPDPFSQLMMALPLLVLYEISIGVSHLARRRKKTD